MDENSTVKAPQNPQDDGCEKGTSMYRFRPHVINGETFLRMNEILEQFGINCRTNFSWLSDAHMRTVPVPDALGRIQPTRIVNGTGIILLAVYTRDQETIDSAIEIFQELDMNSKSRKVDDPWLDWEIKRVRELKSFQRRMEVLSRSRMPGIEYSSLSSYADGMGIKLRGTDALRLTRVLRQKSRDMSLAAIAKPEGGLLWPVMVLQACAGEFPPAIEQPPELPFNG